jgi:hypothetical protein
MNMQFNFKGDDKGATVMLRVSWVPLWAFGKAVLTTIGLMLAAMKAPEIVELVRLLGM